MIIEPTPENIERFKRSKNGSTYWHTEDFWPLNNKLMDSLHETGDLLMDIEMDSEDENKFTLGRIVVNAARKAGITSREYLEELDNYQLIMLTPICIWYKDKLGKMKYTLSSNLPQLEHKS